MNVEHMITELVKKYFCCNCIHYNWLKQQCLHEKGQLNSKFEHLQSCDCFKNKEEVKEDG